MADDPGDGRYHDPPFAYNQAQQAPPGVHPQQVEAQVYVPPPPPQAHAAYQPQLQQPAQPSPYQFQPPPPQQHGYFQYGAQTAGSSPAAPASHSQQASQPQQQQYPDQTPFPMFDGATAALGQQILTNFVGNQGARFFPGSSQAAGIGAADPRSYFARVPKAYFQVTTKFVLRKLLLILFPLANKTWARRRAADAAAESGNVLASSSTTSYAPPSMDVNAPDLYIPVMSFVTYVLLVGLLHGIRNHPNIAGTLAETSSKGLGFLLLEVLLVRAGLYLVNSKSVAWLDIVGLQSYKFVGLIVVLVAAWLLPLRAVYYLAVCYTATMMGLFLLRTYRRLVLPSAGGGSGAQVAVGAGDSATEINRKNYFLMMVFILQYPAFWILAERVI